MKYIKSAAIKLPCTVFTGSTYEECLENMKKAAKEGFLADEYAGTSFVDKEKALDIAKEAYQKIRKRNSHMKRLLVSDIKNDKYFTG